LVGQQITLRRGNLMVTAARATLLQQRADAGDCDLVAKVQGPAGGQRGYFYTGGHFQPDSRLRAPVDLAALRLSALLLDSSVTLTCVPPGSGTRIGIDRDGDGILDGDQP
jgi:hypothetical protein